MDANITLDKVSGMANRSLKQAPDRELGYFRSAKERAYRCNMSDAMFSGLNHDNQEKVLEFELKLLEGQNASKNRTAEQTEADPLKADIMQMLEGVENREHLRNIWHYVRVIAEGRRD